MITIKQSTDKSDEKILDLIREKNKEGYTLFYNKYWKQLLAYATMLVPDRHSAEEIVQNLFISLFTKDFNLKNSLSLRSYLHQAIRNRVANYYRDQHNYKKHIARQTAPQSIPQEHVFNFVDVHDLKKELRRCLDQLPQKYTVVFLMNKDQQLTLREIAHRLERPEGTVEKQLRRVVKFLKENLKIES